MSRRNKAERTANKLKRGKMADKKGIEVCKKFVISNPQRHAVVDPLFENQFKTFFKQLMQALIKEKYSFSFARATDKTKHGRYKDYISRDVMNAKNTSNADVLVSWGLPTRWMLEEKFNKKVLSFVFGFFPDTWICDSKGFWNESMVVDTIGKDIEQCMNDECINWATRYSNDMIRNNKSKRKQSNKNVEIDGDFVFLPTQDASDISVRKYGGVTYPEFMKEVINFCKRRGVGLVIKRHPTLKEKVKVKTRTWRVSQNAKIDKVLSYAKKKLGKRFTEVDGSIHFYCSRCSCMAGLNTAAVVDGCMNNCVISNHASSMFMNSGAVIHDVDIQRGLDTALNMSSSEVKIMRRRQMALIYFLHHRYLIMTDDAPREWSNEDKIRKALQRLA